jgi:hypothetical protein
MGERYEPLDAQQLTGMMQGARDLTRVMRAFYVGLIEQEFTASEALVLTGEYLRGMCGK